VSWERERNRRSNKIMPALIVVVATSKPTNPILSCYLSEPIIQRGTVQKD
jgi:hypothetical protein